MQFFKNSYINYVIEIRCTHRHGKMLFTCSRVGICLAWCLDLNCTKIKLYRGLGCAKVSLHFQRQFCLLYSWMNINFPLKCFTFIQTSGKNYVFNESRVMCNQSIFTVLESKICIVCLKTLLLYHIQVSFRWVS